MDSEQKNNSFYSNVSYENYFDFTTGNEANQDEKLIEERTEQLDSPDSIKKGLPRRMETIVEDFRLNDSEVDIENYISIISDPKDSLTSNQLVTKRSIDIIKSNKQDKLKNSFEQTDRYMNDIFSRKPTMKEENAAEDKAVFSIDVDDSQQKLYNHLKTQSINERQDKLEKSEFVHSIPIRTHKGKSKFGRKIENDDTPATLQTSDNDRLIHFKQSNFQDSILGSKTTNKRKFMINKIKSSFLNQYKKSKIPPSYPTQIESKRDSEVKEAHNKELVSLNLGSAKDTGDIQLSDDDEDIFISEFNQVKKLMSSGEENDFIFESTSDILSDEYDDVKSKYVQINELNTKIKEINDDIIYKRIKSEYFRQQIFVYLDKINKITKKKRALKKMLKQNMNEIVAFQCFELAESDIIKNNEYREYSNLMNELHIKLMIKDRMKGMKRMNEIFEKRNQPQYRSLYLKLEKEMNNMICLEFIKLVYKRKEYSDRQASKIQSYWNRYIERKWAKQQREAIF